jgi:hypothetical protein
MIFWLYLSLLVVVNAANYKFNYINNEWVQTVGGQGQYTTIGLEPVVIQFCIPTNTTLGISDPIEFDDFGMTTTEYTVYTYTFPVSVGPDIKIISNGVEGITLYRSSNPPTTTSISAVCPNDAGYLYAVRRQKRGFHRIRGRGRRLLSVNNGVDIKLKTNIWGEPSIHHNKKYIEVDGDNEVRIDLSDIYDSYPHNLLGPDGKVHKELTPGEIHILTPPISSGNYTIESPNVWTDYIRPIIRVRRKLKQFPTPHFKLKSGESAAAICPSTPGQYSITFTNGVTSACNDHPGGSAPQTSVQCGFSGTGAPTFQPTTNNLQCETDYTVKATCWYNRQVQESYTEYEQNAAVCGTSNGACTQYHSCCCGSEQSYTGYSSASCSAQGWCDCSGWYMWGYYYHTYARCSSCGCESYAQVANSCHVSKTRWVAAPTVESINYYTVTTTACPQPCIGAWGTWSNCGSDNKKSRTYTHSQSAQAGGTECSIANGHSEELACINQGPDFGSTQADGGVASNGRKTASITFSVSTSHAESVTCAALSNGASGTVLAISGSSHKVTFNTAATTETTQTIGGLSDETEYDIYCAVQNAVSGPMDRTTPDLFSKIKSATVTSVLSATADCTAAWSDHSDARCVALSPGSTCSWSAISTLTGAGAPQALYTSDMSDKTFSLTGLTPATSYDCCCSSTFNGDDRPSTQNFKTQGFAEDMTVDSKTQTSITYTFKTLNYSPVTCTIYTAESQWSTKATNSGTEVITPTADTTQKTFSSLKHYTEYHIECVQDDQTTTDSGITNAPTWSAQPTVHSHTITGFVVKTTTDRSEIAVCSAYDEDTTAPGEDAIIAGTGAVSTSGEINIAADTEKSIQISGLTFATTYDVYCAFKGDADTYGGHHTKSAKIQSTTVQPVITSQPSAAEITFHDFKVSTTYDHDKAAICIVLATGSAAPTAGDIANTANILAQFTGDAAAATAHVDTLELGCCGTTYDVYCGQDEYNVLSNKLTVNTIQPTVSVITIHNEGTDRVGIKFTFDHTNDARCILVPRDATAPTIAEVVSGQGAVTFNDVDSVVNTFTPAGTVLQSWTTKTSGTEQTIWFGKADGTAPAARLGTLEDSYLYDAYCAQADTELLTTKKQVETIAETITSALAISNIVWNGAVSSITISDPGAARCTLEYDSSTAPSVQQVLEGKHKDGGAALFSTAKEVLIGGDVWDATHTGLIDCVTYDCFCAHDDEVDDSYDGVFTEVDFKTTCKTITSEVALVSGYTMETDPTHQVQLPLTAWDRMSVEIDFDHSDPVKCIVVLKDAAEPTLTQIFAGTDGDDTAAVSAPDEATGDSFSVMFTGLSDNTDYDVWCAQGGETTSEQERDSLRSTMLFRTVEKRITDPLELATGYTMDGIQITAPLASWDIVSVRIKYSHTDPVQCVLRDDDVVPTLDEIFNKSGASVARHATPDQGTGTAATWFVQEFTGLDEGHKYTAHCAQAKLDDRKNLVSQHSFATVAKKITAALALAPENSVLGCAVGTDPDCPGEDKQIKLPLSSWETVAVTITYSHDGTVRCAALTKDRLTPTNKELQDGLTLEDYESSPVNVTNTAGTQVKVTFDGLLDGTYYDFICVQDRYDTAGDYQILRYSKISYRTVPMVFQEQPSIVEQGHYGIKLALKMSHNETGACVVVPGANIATHATCMEGEGVVYIKNQTFIGETEWTHTWYNGLDRNTAYKLYCCQGRQLISEGLAFTTPEVTMITQDTQVTEIRDTTASVSVGFTDYNNITCVVEAMGSLPDQTAIQALTSGTDRAAHEITKRVVTDTFWIEDNHELMTWYMDGVVNPDISVTQYQTYTFVRATPGYPMRIVSATDCMGCARMPGVYPDTGETDDIVIGSPQQWTPDTTGTYYYISGVGEMVGKIVVSAGTPAMGSAAIPAECVYAALTDMPWNQTLPGQMADCTQPNKIEWAGPWDTYDVINPYRVKPFGEGGLDSYTFPAKIAYNNYNQNTTLETAEKSFDFTGLTGDTKYQAICGATGDDGEWVTSSLVAFRTLRKPGDVVFSLLDPRDDATLGEATAFLPQPLGEVSMASTDALYIAFTINGSDPLCDQTENIMPGESGLSSRVHDGQTLKAIGCAELSSDNIVTQHFEMSCYVDWRELDEPFTFDANVWPSYTSVPQWEPRLPNGYPFKCTFYNHYTGRLQSPCEDAGNYLPVEFKNVTCTATIEGVGVLEDNSCDDGAEGSDYSDCPIGTDYGEPGGCPPRMIDGFCDNSCKLRCKECPRVSSPLPYCGHNADGTQRKWECPDLNENRNTGTNLCNDECPPVCNVCPHAAVLTADLATCGITGWDSGVMYASLTKTPCPEGDPQNPDTPSYDVDFERTQCENTCTFANDGVCDEPEGENNCDDGTDCADCGPSQIKDMFCPSGCLPLCDACPRNLPAPVCSTRDKACPEDRTIVYNFETIATPPVCPDLCFPECFECPIFVEEDEYLKCNEYTTPCGLFNQDNNVTCHDVFSVDPECSSRTKCKLGCPTRCYNCPYVDSTMTALPRCRQLPFEKMNTGCVKTTTADEQRNTVYFIAGANEGDAAILDEPMCSNSLEAPCFDTAIFDSGDADAILAAQLDGFFNSLCLDGCHKSCLICEDLPDPYPSCAEDKYGTTHITKCLDGSVEADHGCFEDFSKKTDCLFGADPVCTNGCGYQCKACPKGAITSTKCGESGTTISCPDGGDIHSYNTNTEIDSIVDEIKYETLVYREPGVNFFCDNECFAQCYNCPDQPDPLPRCGAAGIPCPEDPFDTPTLANLSDTYSTNCTQSKCPILCEQCPTIVVPLPICLDGQRPCEGENTIPACEDGSSGYDNQCDEIDFDTDEPKHPVCTDLCFAQCDHCEALSDPLPMCGQYPDGIHAREPCKDNTTTNADGRCTDKCLPGCVKCDELPDPYPMCGKQPNNQDILSLCLDGTVNAGLDNEGLCADGCATRCELCGEIFTPLPKCGQHVENATHKRIRCEDGTDETMTANGDCGDTCQPTCDFCTDIDLPIPKCGRNPDGTQLNFECVDNEPVSVLSGLCNDGCYPLCEPCVDIVNEYQTCEVEQLDCSDGTEPFCTSAGGQAVPISWESSIEAGISVCQEAANPHPRCNDLCTPVCIKATCDACDSTKSFLKVEDEDSHVNGYPTRMIIQTNGLPIHPMEPYPEGGWPTEQKISDILDINGYTASDFAAAASGSCPFCTKFKLPKYAEKGTQFWQLEADIDVGISTFTGAYLYNHYHATDDVVVSQYGQQLDFCSGHATNDCIYHYHAYPSCVSSYVGNCGLIGYLYDGMPVLSTCRINDVDLSSCYVLTEGQTGTKTSHYTFQESSSCRLDMANGYEFTEADIAWLTARGVAISTIRNFNGYAYIMTKNYPWMMPGFYGTQWGGYGCPKAYTNEWTPQNECVEVSPLCVPLVSRTPQECDCSVDDGWCVETGHDTAVAYYNRRPPVISSVSFSSVSTIINSDSTVMVSVQVSKPIVNESSPLVLNWVGEDAEDQQYTFYYTGESTMADGVTKQYFWEIQLTDIPNKPIDEVKTLMMNSASGVSDELNQRTGFTTDKTFQFENSCTPDYSAVGYDIDGCLGAGGLSILYSECIVDCYPGGYSFENQSVTKICRSNDIPFEYVGCSGRCVAPTVAPAYDMANCDTTTGPLGEAACEISCVPGFIESSSGITVTCPGDGQVFQFNGCNAQCLVGSSAINSDAYDRTNCPGHPVELVGDCSVSCAPNYQGTPIIACESGGEPWTVVDGACEPECIAPDNVAYHLEAPATQSSAVLTCSSGYELSRASNSIFPVYTCPGPGLEFTASGCGIACSNNFDSTVDQTGCIGDPLVRLDECMLTCAEGYGACTGTSCADPQPVCVNEAGGVFGQTVNCAPACSLPNDPDFLAKYNLVGCPGPVYTTESCQLSCAGGFSSQGQVGVSCTVPNGEIQITNGCSSACGIDVVPSEYDLTNCDVPPGGAITEYECQPTCAAGYIAGPSGAKASCSLSTLKFTFTGCSSSNCKNTPSIACDDGIGCTSDVCDPGSIIYDIQYASSTQSGCYHIPTNELCEDSYGCTDNTCSPDDSEADVNGCIIAFVNAKCDDGVSCTTDVCMPYIVDATSSGCVHGTDDARCNDDSVCTVDTCVIGQGCTNEPIECNDGVFCTVDACDPVDGCVYTPDNGLCTDSWPCTADICDATLDCVHTADDAMCVDSYDCTIDKCSLDSNAGLDGCSHELDNTVCNDGASCSTNICAPLSSEDATGCYNTYDNAPCNDGVACTRDFCSPANENATSDTGCVSQNICGIINPACTLDLEVNEEGMVIKPYIPCVEGKTFSSCETVQVTLSERKEEIKKREKTEIEEYLESIRDNPPGVCNPSPCLGLNSTCETIKNETSNATKFVCHCPKGQKGDRCEFLAVSEDTKAPAEAAFFIIIMGGIVIGGFVVFNLIQQLMVNSKDASTVVAMNQLNQPLMPTKIRRRTKRNTLNFS